MILLLAKAFMRYQYKVILHNCINFKVNHINQLIRFILNDKTIETDLPPGTVLLDLIRYHLHLMGTKIGCREGDCGACTVLVGELVNKKLHYESMTSCLLPLGNIEGKHIVTIEGINFPACSTPSSKQWQMRVLRNVVFVRPGSLCPSQGSV
jgi:xanthine dehydrogenase small subunit